MSRMRKLSRAVAKNKSYAKERTTDMFRYYFSKEWREKGYPANLNCDRCPGPTKKGHRPLIAK